MTKIEWADEVWNPVTGCSPISAGCENCYARRMANRLKGRFGYPEDDPFTVTFHKDRLEKPRKWRKPKKIFVCSMGDLFNEEVQPSWWIHIFCHMFQVKHHKFLLLTKRPDRMKWCLEKFISLNRCDNIWLGVTAENQQTADERIPILLQIPAAVRFVSVEPMLEGVGLNSHLYEFVRIGDKKNHTTKNKIDWVICGSETGHRARHFNLDWARDLALQCKTAEVPFFFKSAGKQEIPEDLMVREFPAPAPE